MQTGRRVRVTAGSGLATQTDPIWVANSGLFSGALAQNAGLNGRVRLPEASAAGRNAQAIIEGIQISSFDRCDWELWFWANSLFQVGGAAANHQGDGEAFRGFWSFAVAGGDGKQIGGAGLYYYYIDGLGIHYEDVDAQSATPPPAGQLGPWRAASNGQEGAYLNVTLVNRSAAAKTAGQWFHVSFTLQPEQGQ